MKISYNWLKDYIKTDLPPVKISEILTSIGLEVEALEKFEVIKGGLHGLIIGEVVECEKHPNADKLHITKVNIGNNNLLNIVCGAPNVAVNQKVVVATIGTILYKDDKPFEIKKSKIRGIESEGMLCAEDEIGLSGNHDGIIVLDNDAKIGTPLREFYNINDDFIFEIGLTPNRIDAASHYGVARDLAAYLQHNNPVILEKPNVDAFKSDNKNYPVQVEILNNTACNRYSGVTICNINIKESPIWLQDRLRSIGLRPINNIVDITNYVLFETGQPLHAFDADKIDDKKIIVKTLENKTKFLTLDNVERELDTNDLMICNATKPMCIAGVFGGLESGITNNTKNIFLESAYFNPVFVRKTAKRLGISTDSSFRFERGVDPNNTLYALKRAALLIKEICGGAISSEIVDLYPNKIKDYTVEITFSNVDDIIGKKIPKELIKEIIRSLEIKIIAEKEKSLLLEIPSFKVDVYREIDVIEEILRIYGYNNIEISNKLNANICYSNKPNNEKIVNNISDYLASNGFYEIITNSLTKVSYYNNNALYNDSNCVKILNPISSDLSVLRQTLLYSGLESVTNNINRKIQNVRMFEFGNCYFYNNQNNSENLKNYFESKHLSLFVTGLTNSESWSNKPSETSFFYLKSFVENIIKKTGLNSNILSVKAINTDIFQYGQILFHSNDEIVTYGLLNKKILNIFDIKQPVFYAEFVWENLVNHLNFENKYIDYSNFPIVKRDLALLLNKNIEFSKIKEIAFNTEKKLLINMNLFDVYEGDKIPDDKKSYAVSFYLQDKNKTLTDFVVEQTMSKFTSAFEKELNAQVRK